MKKLYKMKYLLLLVCMFSVLIASAQNKSNITGKLTDESGQPLPGAYIGIMGSSAGTNSDVDGNYKLTGVPNGTITLQVKFIGFKELQRTIKLTGDFVANFTLQSEATALTEVVVIGYGSQQKKDHTGAITTVNAKDFQKGSITTPEQLIAGKIAGVNVVSNGGSPGSGSVIRVRGGASLSASNDPLIVIDGVALSNDVIAGAANPLNLINPNDIATFTVLKDAAATAIYGSRASNGVILITTKKGEDGKPKFNFSTQISAYTVGKTLDVLSSKELADYVNANGNDAQKALLGASSTNWQDQVYQTALGSDNNLSVSGTWKTMPYRVSGGYLTQKGVLVTDKLNRSTLSLNLNPTFFDKHLKVDLNLKGAVSNTRFANQAAIGAAASFDPTQSVTATNQYGNYFEWTTTANSVTVLNPNASRNPVSLVQMKNDNSNVQRSYGNLQLDYQVHFVPGLRANLNLGYDISKGEGTVYVPAEAAQSYAVGGLDNQYQQKVNNKVGEFYLNYAKDLKSIKSTINATAGYGYYDFLTTKYFYASHKANGDIVSGSQPAFPFDKPQARLISYYGRFIYSYDSKYTLAGSLRTDGSSKYAPENRWGLFPSLAFTWRINEENFLKSSRSISDLKLRLSYGSTGQQDGIPYYSYLPVYSYSVAAAAYQFGNTFYQMSSPNAYDSSIKWEQTDTYNAGFDYGFADNRITGAVDVYFKKTKDLLNNIPIAPGSNFTNEIVTNVGNVENKGIEFSINAAAIRTKTTNWDLGFNITYNNNKITNLTAIDNPVYAGAPTGAITGGTGNKIQINSVGYPTNAFYVYKQVYDQNGKPVEGLYEDLNGDGVVNQDDLYRYKSSNPKVLLGFNTQFTYKKWAISTTLRSNIGNYMYNNLAAGIGVKNNILNPAGYLGNSTSEIFKSGFVNNQYQSDYYLQNASFLRMDNLGLSYNAGHVFGSDKNTSLRINANCQNVFVVTKYTGQDPEIFSGIDNNFYPRPRTFVLGVNLDF
ncbi:SusC/RagA family TonB-linked outer membrane protein [Solitalea sp. MAHUQ-68]|uniref:SusC/RagA family TonB-linked outer membrane protein n=1 Tax=Solitalea agri TaxID=2953739 RepID=A0A9X2F3T7_9SPHI|nr:SusC/RagA family TonB-linked outer membrane protein [Solitalea agri]MCO4294254.1 SusC/RagA family TonB-linked outer membrane protein [Solitalea agri]